MIKFFRKIRQKLVDQGNLKRYLIYATGEIFLVMLGILLALQVSNWNQSRIDKNKETKALTDLVEEFQLNRQRIEEKQNLRLSLAPKLKHYINLLSNGKASYKSFQDYHSIQYVLGITNPSNGVIDALISSGGLALISNDSLKYLLADWKDQLGNLYENEQIFWDVTLDYNTSFEQIMLNAQYDWKDSGDEKMNDSFLFLASDITYRNRLVSYEGCQQIVIEECEVVLDFIDNVLELIDRELEK